MRSANGQRKLMHQMHFSATARGLGEHKPHFFRLEGWWFYVYRGGLVVAPVRSCEIRDIETAFRRRHVLECG